MKVAIPTFGSRIAPTFQHCDSMLLARIVGQEAVSGETVHTAGMTEDERIRTLENNRISILVCGGVDCGLMEELRLLGIEIINNVAGETDDVLAHLIRGDLRRGHGITYHPGTLAPPLGPNGKGVGQDLPVLHDRLEEDRRPIDCIHCPDKACLNGGECGYYPTVPLPRLLAVHHHQTLDVTADIAAEPERILCRISELVYFCLGMKYERIGLAFCTDLFSEAETVARLLGRFVHVSSVCCKVGGELEGREEPLEGLPDPACNPIAMARILNEAKTDLNVILGLCMGCDVVFSQLSQAPVTTLFVKDRLLANNPIGAVHSHYVLKHILNET